MFKSFRIKLFIVFLLTTVFISGSAIYLVYRIAVEAQLSGLKKAVVAIASTTALMIDPEEYKSIDINNPVFTEPFKKVNSIIKKVLDNNSDIKYIYTLNETSDPSICKFVADPAYAGKDKMTDEEMKDIDYNVSEIPELKDKTAFSQPVATKDLYIDKWGVWLTGYAPLKDKHGNTVAVVGVDMSAKKIASFQKEVKIWTAVVFIIALIISLLLSIFISSTISLPILKIAEHTKVIADGNFKSKIDINTGDEIKILADCFNNMVEKLDGMFFELTDAHNELKDSYLDTIHSLAVAAEYKDQVTAQHLRRVCEYSRMIADKLSLSKKDIENIKFGSPLHDVGKIGIPDSILLKKDKLTPEEYEVIKEHPTFGYKILKESRSPFLKSAALISLTHHENFDGTGYPNKLKGEDIHIYGRIVALADVFDALTSARPYKKAMSMEEALEIIKNKRGTQFDPKVVDAFLECLDEIKKYIRFVEWTAI
jgi:putative two-component system response regulator